MPALARGQENSTDNINWFTFINGGLADVYSMEFQIWDITTGLPGTQKFPATGWEDVSAAPGKFDTGSYYAYDNTEGTGFTPEAAYNVGTHRTKWRWKTLATSDYQYGQKDFEVLAEVGIPFAYISVQDVRDAGLLEADFPNSQVESAIALWQEVLDRACRQWFVPKELTILFDGNDRDTIHLGVPIISVEHLKLNGSDTALDTDWYKVYSNNTYPDDRRNPRIKLVHSRYLSDVYVAPQLRGETRFLKGRQNQEIKGSFGFVDPGNYTPEPIKRALLKLVIEKLTHPIYTPAGTAAPTPSSTTIAGIILSEKTDGHSVSYGAPSFTDRRTGGISGITQDSEILDIVKLFRAPIGIANTSQWSWS